MFKDFLISVLLSAARDEQYDGRFPFGPSVVTHRPSQRTGQCCPISFVPERHIFRFVREWGLWVLWPLHFRDSFCQFERYRKPVLRECSDECIVFQSRTVCGVDHFYSDCDRVLRQEFACCQNAFGALVGAVECYLQSSFRLLEMEHQCQFHDSCVEFP